MVLKHKKKFKPLPHIAIIAEAIDVPVENWKGRCHEICTAIIDVKLIDGRAQYGLYLGPIHPDGYFGDRKICRHGWIMHENDSIVDPTRWVFENTDPYVFYCPPFAPAYAEYDLAGARFEHGDDPIPPDDMDAQQFDFSGISQELTEFLHVIFDFGNMVPSRLTVAAQLDWLPKLTMARMYWLAHRPVADLGQFAKPIYERIIELGHAALLPIDNRIEVLGKEWNPTKQPSPSRRLAKPRRS